MNITISTSHAGTHRVFPAFLRDIMLRRLFVDPGVTIALVPWTKGKQIFPLEFGLLKIISRRANAYGTFGLFQCETTKLKYF